MEQALDVLIPLLRGETVSAEAGWFTLQDARLQMLPYTRPRIEMAITAMGSKSSAIAAGKYGMGILQFQSVGCFMMPGLAQMWEAAEEVAAQHGQSCRSLAVADGDADAYRRKPRAGPARCPLRV